MAGIFPSTIWSQVASSPHSDEHLQRLCATYWRPVFMYVRTVFALGDHDAEDLTQEFFAHFLVRRMHADASPERGRFRGFLKRSVKNFVIDSIRREGARKRGGAMQAVPFESNVVSAEREFDREWMRCVLDESVRVLKERVSERAFAVFELYDLQASGKLGYRDVAQELNVSETDVTNDLHQARKVLRDIARERIMEYVGENADADGELDDLLGQ